VVDEHSGGWRGTAQKPALVAAGVAQRRQKIIQLPPVVGAKMGSGSFERGVSMRLMDHGLFPTQWALSCRQTGNDEAFGGSPPIDGAGVGVIGISLTDDEGTPTLRIPIINTRSFGEDPKLGGRIFVRSVHQGCHEAAC